MNANQTSKIISNLAQLINEWRNTSNNTETKMNEVMLNYEVSSEMKHIYLECERARVQTLRMAADELEQSLEDAMQ